MVVDLSYEGDNYREISLETEEAVIDGLRSLADWFYRQLEQAWEYENSDENVDETIRINEYDFTADGRIF